MIQVYSLAVISVLLVANNAQVWATSPPNHLEECRDVLGLKYSEFYESSELAYNRTCLNKCLYEKEGKLGTDGKFTLKNPSDAEKACLDRVKATDICKRVNLFDTCITRNTDPFWKKYEECEKLTSYDDDYDANTNHCYNRCQLMVDSSLGLNGEVNTGTIEFERSPNNPITREEALKKCETIVNDKDKCIKDLNMYYCVNYMLKHRSSKLLNIELECGKEQNTYPFYDVQVLETSRPCYDRCVMIKRGDLNEKDLLKSESFKKFNMNEHQLAAAFETCQKTTKEADVCIKDLYIYDCINHLQHVDAEALKNEVDCSIETRLPLVPYRESYRDDACKTRCVLIKEKKLNSNGDINKAYLKKSTINDTIIEDSINECNRGTKKSCAVDVITYNCVSSKVDEKVLEVCKVQSTIKTSMKITVYYQCFTRCSLIHAGRLTPEGEFNVNLFKDTDKNMTIVEEAVRTCKAENVAANECERMFNNYNCVMSKIDTA